MMLLSITGADDNTHLPSLYKLALDAALKHDIVLESALLLFPEKQGQLRNPSAATRAAIRNSQVTAVHLCGSVLFRTMLDNNQSSDMNFVMEKTMAEIHEYNRVQVNINARRDEFTEEEVHKVWFWLLMQTKGKIILQYHARSALWIMRFIERMDKNDFPSLSNGPGDVFMCALFGQTRDWDKRVQILVDGSKGTGSTPVSWKIPDLVFLKDRFTIGMAGGLNATNIRHELARFQADNDGLVPRWADLETGARVENQYDIPTCYQILEALSPTSPT